MISSIEFELYNSRRLDLIDKKYGYGEFARNSGLSEREHGELAELQALCRDYATAPAAPAIQNSRCEGNQMAQSPLKLSDYSFGPPAAPVLTRRQRLQWKP